MQTVTIVPPELLIDLDEAKRFLRVDTDEEDRFIEAILLAAQGNIDGPAGWLGRCVGVQTLEIRMSDFPSCVRLPYPPVLDIASVVYVDDAGTSQTIPGTDYRVTGDGVLEPVFGGSWPIARGERDAVRVRYRAGYEELPAPIRHALLLMVGHWYENRTAVTAATSMAAMPMGVAALLMPYRTGFV